MNVRRLCALVVLALAVLVAEAGPAAAHARLVGTEPGASAVLAEAPSEVVLRFDEEVDAGLGGLTILDESGATVATPSLSGVDGDAAAVRAALAPLADGVYVVEWRVTSADGHPVKGAFPFRVGEGAAPTADAAAGGPAVSAGLDTAVGVAKWAGYSGLALLVGGAAFVVLAWPAGAGWWPARRIAWFGWGLTLVATLAGLGLQGPYAAGLPAEQALDPDLWRDVLQTRFGQAGLLRVALLLAALPLLAILLRGVTRGWTVTAAVLGTGLCLSVAAAGHAGTGRLPVVGLLADTVHVGGMAMWLGGLVVLGLVVLVPPVPRPVGAAVRDDPAGSPPDAGAEVGAEPADAEPPAGVEPGHDPGTLLTAVRRFSAVALVAAMAVVLSGVVQTWRVVGNPLDLADTRYGRTLLVKLVLVAGLLGLAWLSRRAVARLWPAAMGLRRSVLAEIALGALVLAVTASLVQTSPTAGLAPLEPFTAQLVQGNVVADVSVSPAAVGQAELHLLVTLPGGSLQRAQGAEVRLELAERGIGPVPVPLVDEGPNHWSAPAVELPFAGDWDLEVRVTAADGSLVRLRTTMPVSG